jgi:hypothetical protein
MQHLRTNAIAYCALFVALGGTSYAAVSIPQDSIATGQLRSGAIIESKLANGSITDSKLNHESIAGSVVFWARIAQNGRVAFSSQPARTSGWSRGFGSIVFRGDLSRKCFALADASGPQALGFVSAVVGGSVAGKETVAVYMAPAGSNELGALPIAVAVICP